MPQKHILVVSQQFYPEDFRINDMCCELVQRGYKVTVLTGIPNYPQGKYYDGYGLIKKRREVWNGVEIIRIPEIARGKTKFGLTMNYASFVVSGFFWKIFTKLEADCVFTFGLSPMTQALAGVWYACRKKIPHYLYVQDLWPDSVKAVLNMGDNVFIRAVDRMVNYIYKKSDIIFATSEGYVEEISSRLKKKEDKVKFLPQYAEDFYIPSEKTTEFDCLNDESFKIVFTGNIGRAQGLGLLADVACRLKSDGNEDIKFVLVGDGSDKENIIDEIKDKKVEDMFCMIDRQPPTAIPSILAACDVAYISLLDSDVFSMTIPAKLQSYMACGMPVLGVVTGETEKIINNAGCGICCDREEIDVITDCILKLKKETNLEELAKNSRSYAEKYFDKEKVMDYFERVIK